MVRVGLKWYPGPCLKRFSPILNADAHSMRRKVGSCTRETAEEPGEVLATAPSASGGGRENSEQPIPHRNNQTKTNHQPLPHPGVPVLGSVGPA